MLNCFWDVASSPVVVNPVKTFALGTTKPLGHGSYIDFTILLSSEVAEVALVFQAL